MKNLMMSLLLFASITIHADECLTNAEQVSAHYHVSIQNHDNKEWSDELFLWRDSNRVAQQYQHKNITNMWEKTPHGQLHLVRFFDEDKRAIEYQPDEVKVSDIQAYWQQLSQLITDSQIAEMKKLATSGQDCDLTVQYLFEKNGRHVELEWLPKLKLIKSFKLVSNGMIKTWQLAELIKDKHIVNAAFSSRLNYQTTDYADIGDNESDPFFIKMINLGHISHAASGFYDSDGNPLSDAHHH